jgi:ferredoxin
MLDEEAKEKGYALMCVAEPQSDCRIKVIDEVSNF